MRRTLPILAAALALTGCQTMTPADQLAQDRATCEYYGAPVGGDNHFACMMTMAQRRAEQQAEFNAAMSQIGSDIGRMRW